MPETKYENHIMKDADLYSTHKTIFVSSTFQDMHAQRDVLRNKVLPIINKEANKYGQSVSFCDLRWGIDTQDLNNEEMTRKVLHACLEEIDRSSPPVIVLLGDRYGWIPYASLIRKVCAEKGITLDSYDISATHLEIKYTRAKHYGFLFYLFDVPRQGIAPRDSRMEKLRKEAVKDYPADCKTGLSPSDADAFTEAVCRDLIVKLQSRWSSTLSPEEQEAKAHWNYFFEKKKAFCARDTELEQLRFQIRSGKKCIFVKGVSGVGKSALLAELAFEMVDWGYDVLSIACGLTEHSSTCLNILTRVLDFAGIEYDKKNLSEKNLLAGYRNGAKKTGQKRAVVLDGINQLLTEDLETVLSLIQIESGVLFLVSSTPEVDTGALECFTLKSFQKKDRIKVAEAILKANRKELPPELVAQIAEKAEAGSPLYISVLIHRLLLQNMRDYSAVRAMGDTDEARARYFSSLIGWLPDSLESAVCEYFLAVDVNIHPDWVTKAVGYIALSRFGLRDTDLAILMGDEWNDLDFYTLIYYVGNLFIKRLDGRYDFSHSRMRRALETAVDFSEGHKKLAETMDRQPENDPIRARELAYHLLMADERNHFVQYISDIYTDEKKRRYAAEAVRYACLSDKGSQIVNILRAEKNKSKSNVKFLKLLNFVLYELLPVFHITAAETEIKITVLKTLEVLITHSDLRGDYLEQLEKIYFESASSAKSVNEYETAARYGKAFFDCSIERNATRPKNKQERFLDYYNTLVFLKGAAENTEVREWFFAVADKGLENGVYDSADDTMKGQYLGCIGEVYGRCGEPEKQLEVYLKDLELRKRGFERAPTEKNKASLFGGYGNAGMGYLVNEKIGSALECYKKAVALFKELRLDDADEYSNYERAEYYSYGANTYYNYAALLLMSIRGAGTVEEYEKVLDAKEEQLRLKIKYIRLIGKNADAAQLIQEYNEFFKIMNGLNREIAGQLLLRQTLFSGYIQSVIENDLDPDTETTMALSAEKNGRKYSGETLRGLPNGVGLLVEGRDVYYGEFVNGKKHGSGYSAYVGSKHYHKGIWQNGLFNGFGESHFYIGEWCEGKITGIGIRTTNGKSIFGIWEGEKLVKKKPAGIVKRYIEKMKKEIDLSALEKYEKKVKQYLAETPNG